MVKKKKGTVAAAALSATWLASAAAMVTLTSPNAALADDAFLPNNLMVSRSVYDNNPNIVQGVTYLPPGCNPPACVTAIAGGNYPYVFNNNTIDGSFGVTSRIFLDQIAPTGELISSLEVPNSSQPGVPPVKDQMVTSFSSKSELALNLSTDAQSVTFMGYYAPVGAVDVSNSNTPGVIDPTNPVTAAYYRLVAEVDQHGKFRFTKTNAYSGNNGRAAIMDRSTGQQALLYTAGNAGNGADPQPQGVVLGAGTQIMIAENRALVAQNPTQPTPVASFNITELGHAADKIGKDDNFRGLTIFNNVLFYSKGSGSNGVNTVYFADTSGPADPNGNPAACAAGVGLPVAGVKLPNAPLAYDQTKLTTDGLYPSNICILNGFNTTLAKLPKPQIPPPDYPFGLWFANATTLYVADEGNGSTKFDPTIGPNGTYTDAAKQTTAGLQKWVFDGNSNSWKLAYTLTAGLNLGVPYSVAGYPTGNNSVTKLPWAPATDGLRNITGRVNRDGTVTIWAITSTVSGSGDQGADPNQLVMIKDTLSATSSGGEQFSTLLQAKSGEVLRGVSSTPGSSAAQ